MRCWWNYRTGRMVLGIVLLVAGLAVPMEMVWKIVAFAEAGIALVTTIVRF